MLRYFNFEPSFKLQWCCVLDNYLSNKFQCTANLLHSGTLNPPSPDYYALWPSGFGNYIHSRFIFTSMSGRKMNLSRNFTGMCVWVLGTRM